jgi:drug/metabolite transporter (DMT)-like permease
LARVPTWQLFAVCVLVWSTTWHAITWQVGVAAPEVGVALRFALAGAAVLLGCLWRGVTLAVPWRAHALLALQGVFLYGLAYVAVYEAERHLPSGLVAVAYSASPLVAGLGAHALFGVAVTRRFIAGGLLGLAGVALIFWPEFGRTAAQATASRGVSYTVAAVLLSTVGSLAASRNRVQGLSFWPALGFGMLYGAAAGAVAAVAQGRSFALPSEASWWIALLYLALAGSVLTFACFLTLQDRLGPGPSGAIGVMTPLLALAVSMAFEGFEPDTLTAAGAVLALGGNLLMLRRGRAPPESAGTSAA